MPQQAPTDPSALRPAARASAAGKVFPQGARSLISTQFAPLLIAIALAVVGAHIALRTSTATRLSNLDLSRSGFDDSYLVFDPSDPESVFLVRRGAATVRRNEPELQGTSSSWTRFGPGREKTRWILRSPDGSVLLLPLDAIEDWSYPFLFAFVAQQRPELDLPRVAWTQLYVHRVYSGLYLQIDWPTAAAPGGDELVLLGAAGPVSVTTGLDDGAFYAQLSDAGVVPQIEPPDELLAWLASLGPTAETVLLLPDAPPFGLRRMPLPFSLSAAYELRWGRPLEGRPGLTPPQSGAARDAVMSIPLPADEIDRLRSRFAAYTTSLRHAVAAHRWVFGPANPPAVRTSQRAADLLGWSFEDTAP